MADFSNNLELIAKAQAGDDAALNQLIINNEALCVSLIAAYVHGQTLSDADFADMMQEARIGLMTAVRKFDTSKNAAFSTYAAWWVRSLITRNVRMLYPIYVPAYFQDKIWRVKRAINNLQQAQATYTQAELAATANVRLDELDFAQQVMNGAVSLDMVMYDGDTTGVTLADILPAPDHADAGTGSAHLREWMLTSMMCLSPRERYVIERRYGFHDGDFWSLDDVGKQLHVTRERIRQLEVRGLAKLRHEMTATRLAQEIG